MSADKMEIKLYGYEVLEKEVKSGGGSGHVYVPISWVGKKIKLILLER